MSIYDLHSHTHYSDGELSPSQLIAAAELAGIHTLAITDHDTLVACQEIARDGYSEKVQVIFGVEISAIWRNQAIHVLGLKVDLNSMSLNQGLQQQQMERQHRAKAISEKLANLGISDTYKTVCEYAHKGLIARPHFARLLMERGIVKTLSQAFQHYLGRGKPAFVATQWVSMEEAIRWIQEAGGYAVLAHPVRYKLTSSRLLALLEDFKTAGGIGIEVSSSSHQLDDIQRLAFLAQKYDFYASAGSDYHGPSTRAELGRFIPLPTQSKPIWKLWSSD